MKKYGFPKSRRLRKAREFERVFQAQQRAGDRHLLVLGARNDLGWTRIGLVVSKKHGKAVRRNRLKRLLREAYRLSQHQCPEGLDLILIPKKNSQAGLGDYQRSIVRAARTLARRVHLTDENAEACPGSKRLGNAPG